MVSSSDPEFRQMIHNMPTDNEYEVHLVVPIMNDQSMVTLHFDEHKIVKKNNRDVLLYYKQIDALANVCSIDETPGLLQKLDNI